jgi:chemotaxis-related protein WspD
MTTPPQTPNGLSFGLPPGSETSPAEAPGDITGCWGEIGVYGDSSCSELQKFIHCRNCPVYSAAGVRLIDRPLPKNYRQEWTQHFSIERQYPEPGSASVILFRLQDEWLAMPTHSFQEVAEKRPIHSLPPRREGSVLGLANVRGELVVCISLGHLLQTENVPSLETLRLNYQRLLVIQWEARRLAFPVDEVHGPQRVHAHELKGPPAMLARNSRYARSVFQWQDRTAGLVDPHLVFSSVELG